jgi:hypothetical protein
MYRFAQKSHTRHLVGLKKRSSSDIDKELEKFERRLDELDNDPIMRIAANNYKAMLEKAKTNMGDRYIAAAKEKDPFWRAAKKPIVFPEELR